ncbi:hypothetical protein SDC9_80588 [bioreactor metagenome]|uniref:PhoU domain-containing protein n=1 Tax=bioreactor metagenome TaxID=1076179 RepID=A0A644Z051_9ZZZZ
MDIFNLFTLMGGLAMFLYGMNVMGGALEKRAGGQMKTILAQLTASRLRGFLLGMGVTAVIQSSSATTVMVVGLVNSGIMELSQAVNVIMGANVGTTATAWVLSLTGLKGDGLLIRLLKPSSFTPLLALWGIILHSFSRNTKRRDTGLIFLGFAVLMFGMQTMSDAVAPLADVPEFSRILLLFSNPLLGVLAGALVTGVIQSSSASVGILQALAVTGSVTYGSAIPIIMGQNIGTCVTALISSVGATKNAKRAAMVHLYFNILGTAFWLLVYIALNGAFRFAFVDEQATTFGIAVIHSCFNIACTLLLLPLSDKLERLARLTVKDTPEREELQLLDERLLSTPSIAIERSSLVAGEMARLSKETFQEALELLDSYDSKRAENVLKAEDQVDLYEDRLGTYLVQLSARSLSFSDSQGISRLLHAIGDFERISDHAVNVQEAAQEIHEKKIVFSPQARQELEVMMRAVREILELSVSAFLEGDLRKALQVEPLEQVVDDLRLELKNRHVQRLQKGECTIELGFVFSDLLTNFERVSDHCSNLAVCMIELSHNSLYTHEYLHAVKSGNNQEFIDEYNQYRGKYNLL